MKYILALVAVGLLLTSCSNQSNSDNINITSSHIMYGESLQLEDPALSYTVALTKEETLNSTTCTASLITRNHIITAQHCLTNLNLSKLRVAFISEEETKFVKLKKSYSALKEVKEMYNFKSKYFVDFGLNFDIAVVELEEEAPKAHNPIEILDWQRTKEVIGKDINLNGFGVTEDSKPGNPKTVTVKALDIRTTAFEKSVLIYEGEDKKGACNGDSGGPATISLDGKTYLVGATHGYATASFESQDTNCSSGRGIYTYLPYFKAWIDSKINNTEYETNTFDPFEFATTSQDNDLEYNCESTKGLTLNRWFSLYIYATKTIENYKCSAVKKWFMDETYFSEKATSKADLLLGNWKPLGNYYFLKFFNNLKSVSIDQSMRLTRRDQMVQGIDKNIVYLSHEINDITDISSSVTDITIKGGKLKEEARQRLKSKFNTNLVEVETF